MKLISKAILSLAITFGAFASANGIERGEKLCQSLNFASEKMKCISEVHKGRFYQHSAMAVCENMTFSREKLECIEKIRNKSYTETLLQTCKEMTFPSKILECLAQFGQVETEPTPVVLVPPTPLPSMGNGYPAISVKFENEKRMKKTIRKALKQMDKGNYFAARRILEDALDGYAE